MCIVRSEGACCAVVMSGDMGGISGCSGGWPVMLTYLNYFVERFSFVDLFSTVGIV